MAPGDVAGGSTWRKRQTTTPFTPAPAGRRRSLAITADVADAAQVQAMGHRVVAGKPRAWRSSAASAKLRNAVQTALLITYAALRNPRSAGCHYRNDSLDRTRLRA